MNELLNVILYCNFVIRLQRAMYVQENNKSLTERSTQKKGTHTNHKIIKMHFSFLFQHLIAASIIIKKNPNDCYDEKQKIHVLT